ncbi:MAG TPA: helix-hairpin-helix domain-containing protein [Parafilimonas sp.]|nr:helix-hairpin-helix domain-containing protein [Parafilimonas sp.]
MIKSIWKDYFTFSKKERNAVFILLTILAVTIVVPYFIPEKKLRITIDQDLQQQLDQYLAKRSNVAIRDSVVDSVATRERSFSLFEFDPNTLSKEGFKKLGLNDKVIQTIFNYRSKGGYFKVPDDIRKVYGLSATDAERLLPYIRIASISSKERNYSQEKHDNEHNYPQRSEKKIEINTATADEWKSLPGIGEVLGNRIVKFRNAIGGFKSVDQVRKTYGLSDSTFKAIMPYLVLTDSLK